MEKTSKNALISNHPVVDLEDVKIIEKIALKKSTRGRYQRL